MAKKSILKHLVTESSRDFKEILENIYKFSTKELLQPYMFLLLCLFDFIRYENFTIQS